MSHPYGGASYEESSGQLAADPLFSTTNAGAAPELHADRFGLATLVDPPRLLMVGAHEPGVCESIADSACTLRWAATWQQAMAQFKQQTQQGETFDLVVFATRLADGSGPWPYITLLRRARPWQAWVLVGPAEELDPAMESKALAHGASGVFESGPQWDEVLSLALLLRRRHAGSLAGRSAIGACGAAGPVVAGRTDGRTAVAPAG